MEPIKPPALYEQTAHYTLLNPVSLLFDMVCWRMIAQSVEHATYQSVDWPTLDDSGSA